MGLLLVVLLLLLALLGRGWGRVLVMLRWLLVVFLSVLAPLTVVLLFYGTVLVLVVVHWY
jgi:hypothetical protein